jgi:hypothetical protein
MPAKFIVIGQLEKVVSFRAESLDARCVPVVVLEGGADAIFELKQVTMGRCYDFKNIFAEKFSKSFCVFCSKHCSKNCDHNIGF